MTAHDGNPVRRPGVRRPGGEPPAQPGGLAPAAPDGPAASRRSAPSGRTAPAGGLSVRAGRTATREAVPHPAGVRSGEAAGTSGGGRTPAQRRRALLAAVLTLAVLAGGGSWLVWGSPLLRAEHVTVQGNHVVSDDQIIRAAHVPLGGALLSVDTGAVRHRLLKALPRLGEVRVRRSWPHTVRLVVTERTASAVLPDGSRWTEVDGSGVRFATVDHAPKGVPVLRLDHPLAASVRQFGTQRLLRAAIRVSADLPARLRGHATAILVHSYDGITVELTGGRTVVWGSQDQGARKAAVLTALMKAEPDAFRYDVSAPDAPAADGS